MANAIIARDQGSDYQARFFWLKACRLFHSHTKVASVAYELDRVKSFDDVVVSYKAPLTFERGETVAADYYQVKFHVDQNGSFTYHALTNPKFINATRFSPLQRLHAAQQRYAPDGLGCRFYVVSPWSVHPDDPLSALISNNGGEIRLNVLFDATGNKSAMGKVRKLWRDHLGLSCDDDLIAVLRPLRIWRNAPDLAQLNDQLNISFEAAGFKPVETGSLVHPYDDLIRKLKGQGDCEFTREQLQEIAESQNLWLGRPTEPKDVGKIGIRSFVRWAEHMEDETEDMLDLVQFFDNREIREGQCWNQKVLPAVIDFISKYERTAHPYHLLLDTHSSIAFTAGFHLEAKLRADIWPVQRAGSQSIVWQPEQPPARSDYPRFTQCDWPQTASGSDIAVAISITHDILGDVKHYVSTSLPAVGKVVHFRIEPDPNQRAVIDGTHAHQLAQVIAQAIKQRSAQERGAVLNIFAAAPNGVMFFLGQLARDFGRCVLYEHDFGSSAAGAYHPSIFLPPGN